jgi:acyl carrier protein
MDTEKLCNAEEKASENEIKLRKAFAASLNLLDTQVNDHLRYSTSPGWDSIAHLAVVAALDSAFDIMLDPEDIIDISSFAKAREILAKYGVQF